MSRLDGRYADVAVDDEAKPRSFIIRGDRSTISVTGIAKHWREWIGILNGNAERDIWHVETPRGTCELHNLRQPTVKDTEPTGYWMIFRWED